MKITAIVCTYNRCQSLLQTLESIAGSILPESVEWEVLVVDNNSKDQTREVAESFCQRYPGRFRYVFESQQGHTRARNRGVREARGDILAFTDDDVIVEPTWLENLTNPLKNGQWSGAGGRILLADFQKPSWLAINGSHSLAASLAGFDLGDQPLSLDRSPFGASMAFKKSVFEKFGGFRTDLGRLGTNLIGNDDTEFCTRIMGGGEKILYVPSAVVYHAVGESRLTKDYFLTYHFDYGRALIREKGDRKPVGFIPRSFISFSNRLLNTLPRRVWWWLRESDPQKRFFNKCHVWTTAGEIVEIFRR